MCSVVKYYAILYHSILHEYRLSQYCDTIYIYIEAVICECSCLIIHLFLRILFGIHWKKGFQSPKNWSWSQFKNVILNYNAFIVHYLKSRLRQKPQITTKIKLNLWLVFFFPSIIMTKFSWKKKTLLLSVADHSQGASITLASTARWDITSLCILTSWWLFVNNYKDAIGNGTFHHPTATILR